MANKDRDFLCPDCSCQVMQDPNKNNFCTIFYCRQCSLGPLVICPECMNLITLEDYMEFYCPYCEEGFMLPDNQMDLDMIDFN